MIWFYARGEQRLYYEVRLREDGPGFELGLASPEGPLLTERFATEAALSQRFAELEAALVREGWGPLQRRPYGSAFESTNLHRRATDKMVF